MTPSTPPPIRERFDFSKWWKRASTWLAGIVSSAGALLTWYITQPDYIQHRIPEYLITVASVISMLGVIVIPLATSYSQRNMKKGG